MSFEAEVIPLFIGGVLVVSSFELIVGCVLLKNKKSACKKFVLHVITMLIGFAFLIRFYIKFNKYWLVWYILVC